MGDGVRSVAPGDPVMGVCSPAPSRSRSRCPRPRFRQFRTG
ncbi:hypothetical protein [Nocardia nova]